MSDLEWQCRQIRREMCSGGVIPFLGAGTGNVGRNPNLPWNNRYTPTGCELRDYLVDAFDIPDSLRESDLAKVAEFAELMTDEDRLMREIRAAFSLPTEPTPVHEFLAAEIGRQRDRGFPNPWPIIITTNYDDALDAALAASGEPFHVVEYVDRGEMEPHWVHVDADSSRRRIRNRVSDLVGVPEDTTLILKLHGALHAARPDDDRVVITEAHYASFLAHIDLNRMPAQVVARLDRTRLLFLGYSLSDWNLRVLLLRLRGRRKKKDRNDQRSWSLQPEATSFDTRFWDRRGINVLDADMDRWMAAMLKTAA